MYSRFLKYEIKFENGQTEIVDCSSFTTAQDFNNNIVNKNGIKQIVRVIFKPKELANKYKISSRMESEKQFTPIELLNKELDTISSSSLDVEDDGFIRDRLLLEPVADMMKLTIPEGAAFSVETDLLGIGWLRMREFKDKIMRIVESTPYSDIWKYLAKNDYILRENEQVKQLPEIPENINELINKNSLFYLILNHGTSSKNSKLHTDENPTHSIQRLLATVNLNKVLMRANREIAELSVNPEQLTGMNIKPSISIMQPNDLNENSLKEIACDHDFLLGEEVRSMKLQDLQDLIIAIITKNASTDWPNILGYHETKEVGSSGVLTSLFKKSAKPARDMKPGWIFQVFNAQDSTWRDNSYRYNTIVTSKPTAALNKLFDLLEQQHKASQILQSISKGNQPTL